MRYVGHDEQVQLIASALRRVPTMTVKQLAHFDTSTRLKARVAAALVIVEAMKRLEVLTSAPEGVGVNYQAISGISGTPPRQDDG